MAFNNFPYTNLHELNLDWVISEVKEYLSKVDVLSVNVDTLNDLVANLQEELDGIFTSEEFAETIIPLIQTEVYNWLDEHPEATTSVLDHSLSINKLVIGTLNYVTPQMFGAVGDGVTDDSTAVEQAAQAGIVLGGYKTYFIGNTIDIENSLYNCNFILDDLASVQVIEDNSNISNCTFKHDSYPATGNRGKWLLRLDHVKNATVENCSFSEGVSCLYLDTCDNITITKNKFVDIRQTEIGYNGYGVCTVESKNIVISNNVFKNVARHSVYLSVNSDGTSGYNENIIISNNVFSWDSNVIGNTSGFECTIAIRPTNGVLIQGNIFNNMFTAFATMPSLCTVAGSAGYHDSTNVLLRNNFGTFSGNPRANASGVITFNGTGSANVPPINIDISNNTFMYSSGAFIVWNAGKDINITGNNIICSGSGTFVYIYSTPDGNTTQNLSIENNTINATNILILGGDTRNYGNISISKNKLTFSVLGTLGNGQTTSLIDTLYIVDNILNTTANRAYFSNIPVTTFIAKSNYVPNQFAMYIAATNAPVTDPAFIGYGFNAAHPTVHVGGVMQSYTTGDVYISKSTGDWVQIT